MTSLTSREKALCTVAEKLSGTPTKMVENDWKPLRDLGFDDEACLEVAHIVGIFNHLTRMADGFGLKLDAGTNTASKAGTALHSSLPTSPWRSLLSPSSMGYLIRIFRRMISLARHVGHDGYHHPT